MRLTRAHSLAIVLTAAALATPLAAQRGPMVEMHGAGSPADVVAGTYAVEPNHTQVTFSVSHFGITPFSGTFSGASGSLMLDPANPGATKLSVSIPVASVMTTSTRLTEELKGADWLDAGKYPVATFVSSKVTAMGTGGAAEVEGTLTLHGVSKPATIAARFYGTGANPMSHKVSVGFVGRTMFKRSDFGVTRFTPMVADDTTLLISAAFEKQ